MTATSQAPDFPDGLYGRDIAIGGSKVSIRRKTLNFIGDGITAVDNPTTRSTDVDLSALAGGGGSPLPNTIYLSGASAAETETGGDGAPYKTVGALYDQGTPGTGPGTSKTVLVDGGDYSGEGTIKIQTGDLRALGDHASGVVPRPILPALALLGVEEASVGISIEGCEIPSIAMDGAAETGGITELDLRDCRCLSITVADTDLRISGTRDFGPATIVAPGVRVDGDYDPSAVSTLDISGAALVQLRRAAASVLVPNAPDPFVIYADDSQIQLSQLRDDGDGTLFYINEGSLRRSFGPATNTFNITAGTFDDMDLGPLGAEGSGLAAYLACHTALWNPDGNTIVKGILTYLNEFAWVGTKMNVNISAHDLTFKHLQGTSFAKNQLKTPGGSDLVIGAGEAFITVADLLNGGIRIFALG